MSNLTPIVWRPRVRRAFSVVELLVIIVILAISGGMILVAVQRVREAANRAGCTSQLMQLGLALHHYHHIHGHFPAGTSFRGGADPYPHMSWLTRLLPYIEQEPLWRSAVSAFEFEKDFRLNPPHTAASQFVRTFHCPADSASLVNYRGDGMDAAHTSYLGVAGLSIEQPDGVLFLDSAITDSDVTDGLSNTLFIGERPPSADGRLGLWYAGTGQQKTGSADHYLGVRELNQWTTNCDPGPYSFGPGDKKNNCDAFHFWSHHSGVAIFGTGDGSVRMLRYSKVDILPALATRAGDENVREGFRDD